METVEYDEIDWEKWEAESEIKGKVITVPDAMDDAVRYLEGNLYGKGAKLTWDKTHSDINLRLGEVSIWAGINGHGKSLMVGQIFLDLVQQGYKSLIASFEMPVGSTLGRMIRQASGNKFPTLTDRNAFTEFSKDKLFLFSHHGLFDAHKIPALCKYASQELGIQHIVIDSMFKVIKGEDDYNGQKDFVATLCAIAMEYKIHIHLVHHIRKSADENHVSGKFDLKGSGAITDSVDNVFIVWKNKRKAQDRKDGLAVDNTIPDAFLVCEKQRHGEWEGRIGLWFDPASQQFLEYSNDGHKRYLVGTVPTPVRGAIPHWQENPDGS